MSDDQHHTPPSGEKKRWLDDPKNVDKIWYGLIGVCVLLFFADFAYKKHPYFPAMENLPNFYGFYGFIGCFLLVVAAAQLRKLIMRDEDYYEERDATQEKKNFGSSSAETDGEGDAS